MYFVVIERNKEKIIKKKKKRFPYLITLCLWLHLTNNNFNVPISIEKILDQPIFLNPYFRLNFKHPTQEY